MANFTKPMKWNNKGIEPSETLKNQGFKGGYKPPAEVFNYFLNNSEICIDELQKATDKAQNTADSAGAAAALAQAAANNAQSAADNAKTTADEAQSTAENAKSAAAEAQTTAEGKADGTHKHKKSDITDFPTSITPTSHASPSTTYGLGNGSNYGHLKLSDSTTGTSGESSGVAATPAAVKSVKAIADTAKSTADSAKAAADKAQNTASSAATAASSAQSTAESAGAAAALAQAAANNAQSAADNAKTAADEAQSTAENAKSAAAEAQTTAEGKADGTHKHKKSDITDFPTSITPTSHASPSTTYGLGNGSNYGHLKLSDSITSTSGVSSGVAATPAAVKAAADKSIIPQYISGTLHFTSAGGYDTENSYRVINFVPSIIKVYYVGTSSASGSGATPQLCTILTPPASYNSSSYTNATTTWRGNKLVSGSIAQISKGKTYYWQPMGNIGYYIYEIMGYKETT